MDYRDAKLISIGLGCGLIGAVVVMMLPHRRLVTRLSVLSGLVAPAPTARRVVTGHDAAGRSVVLSDAQAPHPRQFGDLRFMELWRTLASPAPIDAAGGEPPGMGVGLGQRGGSVLRLIDFAPAAEGGRRTPLHRTETVDYAIVLRGEIVLVLDDSEVLLKAGDVVIQQGTAHAWENRSAAVARVAFVLLDGVFSKDLAVKLAGARITR